MRETYVLKLYVAGRSTASVRAQATIERLCRRHLDHRHSLQVIDVLREPEAAEAGRVVAVPTLVREEPLPPRRIVGDLSDHALVLAGLDLQIDDATAEPNPE